MKLSVMKAKKVKPEVLQQWTTEQWQRVAIEPKINGFRYSRKNGEWSSKQGKLLFNVKEIQKTLDNLPKIRKYMIDGELAGRTWAQTMTIFRSSKADVSEHLKDGIYHVFDLVNLNDLNESRYDRKCRLIEALEKVNHPRIQIVESTHVNSFKDFLAETDRNLAEGCDGSVIKFNDCGYEFKRSGLWLKYKPQKELDCKIVGFKEGKGKYVGMLGSLQVKVPVGRGWSEHTTNVSGMDDGDRVRMWRMRKSLLGSIVEVEFRELSKKNKMIEAHVYRPRPDKEV